MRIRISGGPEPWTLRVENAETGELVRGVIGVRVCAAADVPRATATLILDDFEIDDLVAEAESE